ncbi:MAG: hypothetical protein AAGI46_05430 [Planctomycetota bacterium]
MPRVDLDTPAIPREPLRHRPMAELVEEGVALSVYYGMKITPSAVARVLDEAGVPYVLAGAHAVNAHTGRPRATRDVDVLTDAPKKAAEALLAAFPELQARDTPVVTRLLLDGDEAVDVMKAKQSKLFRRVVKTGQQVTVDGTPVRVPSVESLLAMKFNSMIFLGRQLLDRQQDGLDFARLLLAADTMGVPVDLDLLRELGQLVYAGGGDEILRHADDVRAGRPMQL